MPIYEYECEQCGHHFDALRSFKEADAVIECKQCHGLQTHRKLSTFYAHSGGRSVAGTDSHSCSGGCGNCSGGSCGHCSH
ncbi:MAG: zinc ribbon domain-containing protein [Anaerolineae bacterium]|nr:zinc ribbon domain-containing protein [Anaerolineae bacterium]